MYSINYVARIYAASMSFLVLVLQRVGGTEEAKKALDKG